MDYYYDLKKMLCKELENVADQKELSAGDLETVDKLTHSIKSLVILIIMVIAGHVNIWIIPTADIMMEDVIMITDTLDEDIVVMKENPI